MKIIITDCDHKDIKIEADVLQKAGVEFELLQCRSEEDLIRQCREGDIFINQYAPITRRVMEALPKLKLVVRYGVGVDNVDIKAAELLGVQVCNVPDYGVNEVADHALSMMLSLVRRTVLMNHYTKTETWDYVRAIPVRRLSTITVGVIGLGRIGKNFSKKVSALGCRVIGFDPYYQVNKEDGTDFIEQVSFEKLLELSDVISIHCPLEGAVNLIGRKELEKMRSSAYLINVARGGIVNEEALDEALEKGEVAGAGFDCMVTEPMLPGSPLFRHDNFIVTPHMAWYSEESAVELKRKVAEEAVRMATGKTVCYPVNHPKSIRK